MVLDCQSQQAEVLEGESIKSGIETPWGALLAPCYLTWLPHMVATLPTNHLCKRKRKWLLTRADHAFLPFLHPLGIAWNSKFEVKYVILIQQDMNWVWGF